MTVEGDPDMKRSWTNEPILKFKIMAIPPYVNKLNKNIEKELEEVQFDNTLSYQVNTSHNQY